MRADDPRAVFVRDLTRSLEQQLVGVDLEDVRAVFDGVRAPVLGSGCASRKDRALVAARAALLQAGRVGRNTLVVIAAAPQEFRLEELKLAYGIVRDEAEPDAHVILAPCHDPALPPGQLRIAVLTG
jgi:cell division GTPase FtsZ